MKILSQKQIISLMRKTLLFLIIALLAVSCQDATQDPTKDTKLTIIDLKVSSSQWIENSDVAGTNKYYTYHFAKPDITSAVFNSGAVASYLLIENQNTPQSLPFVRQLKNSAGASWSQTIDFDYAIGGVNVYVTNSSVNADPPNAMDFNVVLN